MKKVGIKNFDLLYFLNSTSLKSDYLYFDEILFDPLELEKIRPFAKLVSTTICDRTGNLYKAKSKEIDFLIKNNLLSEFKRVPFSNHNKFTELKSSETILKLNEEGDKLAEERNRLIDLFFNKNQFDNLERLFTNITDTADNHSLFLSFISNFENNNHTIPIIFNNKNLNFGDSNKSSFVLNIVLNKFPSLDKNIGWKQVKEIKSDLDLKNKYFKLNNWINDLSKQEYSKIEIEEKIEHLISEYENQLRLHHKKIKYNRYELILNSSLGIIENLIKLNITQIGKNILDVKKEKVNLEIEKQFIYGNEIAYISEVNQLTSRYQTTYNIS